MEVRREWWLLWEMEGRFTLAANDAGKARPGSLLPEEATP
jgi:hypothetical protein